MKHKIPYYFGMGVIISAGILIIYIFYMLFFPYNPIDFNSITLQKDTYRINEPLTIRISYCKHLPLPAETTGQFIDGIIFTLPTITANSPATCGNVIVKDLVVPAELVPGIYIYRQTMVYQVNPIREVTEVFQTPEFEVIE